MTLSILDWAIIAVYSIGFMAAELSMRWFVSDANGFELAGRKMDVNLGITSPMEFTPASATNPINITTGHANL